MISNNFKIRFAAIKSFKVEPYMFTETPYSLPMQLSKILKIDELT